MKKNSFTYINDITILIPCYNATKTLDRLFNSIKRQKYPSEYLKIIALNDGSTDNTLEVLKSWQTTFGENKMKIIDQTNTGLGVGRKVLSDACETEWFIYIDSDDYFYGDTAIKSIANASKGGTVDIVVSKTLRVNGKHKSSWWLTNFLKDDIFSYISNNLWFMWNKLYKTSVYKKANFIPIPKNDLDEDICFLSRYVKFANKVGTCKKYTYCFVYSTTSMSSTTRIVTPEKTNQVLENFNYSLSIFLSEKNVKMLNKKDKKMLSVIVFTYLMHLFLLHCLFPAWNNFPNNEKIRLKNLFYSNIRYKAMEILNKYNVKILSPAGWWRKIVVSALLLKSRYNLKRYKRYEKDKIINV